MAVDRFKCASALYFTLIINKHFNFCCFRALANTTLDRLCAVFLYNIRLYRVLHKLVKDFTQRLYVVVYMYM